MREAVRVAVPFRNARHRDFLAHLGQQRIDARAARRLVFGVHAHVEERVLHLPERVQPGVETARGDECAPLGLRNRHTGRDVSAHAREHLRQPGVVFHELARQLDGVPGHAVDTGDARISDARQHVMQAVAELVEQRHHVVVGQQRRPPPLRRQRIAHQVGDRQRERAVELHAADAVVHPGAAALVGARAGIEVKAGERRAVGRAHLEVAHVGVPHRHATALLQPHAVQASGDFEQALQHPRQRQVLAQLLLRDLQAAVLQALGIIGDVPGIERSPGVGLELGQLGHGARARRARKFPQEVANLPYAAGHAVGERVLGIRGKIEQPRRFVAQPHDVFQHRRIVVTARGRPPVRSARAPGFVEHAPERRRLGVGDDGHVGRLVEAEHPAGQALARGARGRLLDDAGIQPGELCGIGEVVRPVIGGIQHLFLELRLQQREFAHDGLEARLAIRRQRHAGEAEIAQRALEHCELHGVELRGLVFTDILVGTVERCAL